MFAAARARDWPVPRRLLYTAAAPLIPLVRFWRILQLLRHCGREHHLLPRILPVLFIALVLDGLGEALGYALGGGDAVRNSSEYEFHRDRNLTAQDREAFAAQ